MVSLIKTGNSSCLGVRIECHIVQTFLISEVIECANLQSLHGIIYLSTDDTQTQPRYKQDTGCTDLFCQILTLQSRSGID